MLRGKKLHGFGWVEYREHGDYKAQDQILILERLLSLQCEKG